MLGKCLKQAVGGGEEVHVSNAEPVRQRGPRFEIQLGSCRKSAISIYIYIESMGALHKMWCWLVQVVWFPQSGLG